VKNELGLIETMVDKRLPQAEVYVSAEQRIKKMHYTMITKEFCDVMNEINSIQTTYQEKLKEKMVRQLAVMNPDGTDYTNEQINEMIETGKTSIWTQNLLRETEDARQKLSAVQARHEEIVKLEKSIVEVHEMFLDLAILVESQGAMINNIEDNVLKTTDYVKTATVELDLARKHQASFNKKRWCCIGLIVIIVLIIVIVLAVEFSGGSSS
jgi:t-SNARE complex subunit (syntaxin)